MPLYIHRLVQDAAHHHVFVEHIIIHPMTAAGQAADRRSHCLVPHAEKRVLGDQIIDLLKLGT